MPALEIIVCTHALEVNSPIFGRERRALDPMIVDVTDHVLEGLGLSLTTEELEHWADFTAGQERQGHQFFDISMDAIVACISCLKSQFLNLSSQRLGPVKRTAFKLYIR